MELQDGAAWKDEQGVQRLEQQLTEELFVLERFDEIQSLEQSVVGHQKVLPLGHQVEQDPCLELLVNQMGKTSRQLRVEEGLQEMNPVETLHLGSLDVKESLQV